MTLLLVDLVGKEPKTTYVGMIYFIGIIAVIWMTVNALCRKR